MVILVCGGRKYSDKDKVFKYLDIAYQLYGPFTLVEGGAKGADSLAHYWYTIRGVGTHEQEKADWNKYGDAAGPIRNQLMIDKYNPNLVIAFPGDVGTADMVAKAKKANIPVLEVT